MHTVFEIISHGFARHVLSNMTGDPARDTARALTMNHLLLSGSPSRLTGWAIFRASGSTVQAKLAAPGVETGDTRTRFQAFAYELARFREPVVLLTFTKSTVNIGALFATYDSRITRICGPAGNPETFDFTALRKDGGIAERNVLKALEARRKEGSDAA